MRLINMSAMRQRIEGFGYVNPGEPITVPDSVGRQLRKSGEFRESTKGLINQAPTIRRDEIEGEKAAPKKHVRKSRKRKAGNIINIHTFPQ